MDISKELSTNKSYLESLFKDCNDIHFREYSIPALGQCLILYIETTVNTFDLSDLKPIDEMDQAVKTLLAGNVILFCQGKETAYKVASQGYPRMGVTESDMEKVLRGSKEGFGDSVKMNVALVRKRLKTPDMKMEELFMGTRSDTVVSIVYMKDKVPEELLEDVKSRLNGMELQGIWDSGMIEHLAVEKWYSPFPRFQTTQRPDRAAQELLKGRILLLVDNSPVGLLLPTTFHNFLEASEDLYNRKEIAVFTKGLRYMALFLALTLSGTYLAVITFHTQLLPTQLLLSFAAARQGVPFSSLMEILIMELAFELIREAGIRMPGPLGGTIGIVGGLIIGDAAVGANLVSPMVVIIVALTALGTFAIPNDEFASSFRILKYLFIFLGSFFGLFGIGLGLFMVTEHLAGLSSFRIPYLMPYVCREKREVYEKSSRRRNYVCR